MAQDTGSPRHRWPKTGGPRLVAQDWWPKTLVAQDTGGPRLVAQDWWPKTLRPFSKGKQSGCTYLDPLEQMYVYHRSSSHHRCRHPSEKRGHPTRRRKPFYDYHYGGLKGALPPRGARSTTVCFLVILSDFRRFWAFWAKPLKYHGHIGITFGVQAF